MKSYTNPRSKLGFTGTNVLQRYSKLPNGKLTNELEKIPSYVLHREVKRPRQYNPFIIYTKRDLFQADLIDMQLRSQDNDGIKYILIVCDTLTRKCWARPLQDKTADTVLIAFKAIHKESGSFKRLMTDAGSEFISRKFKLFLNKNKIEFIRGNPHSPHVERLNRTLKTKIWKYMTHNETKRWIDVLDDIVFGYNNRYHRIIKMTPHEAEQKQNYATLLNNVT